MAGHSWKLVDAKCVVLTIHSDGPDRTGLVAFAQRYIDQLWMPTHLTPDPAREFVLDQFKRAMAAEVEMFEVRLA